MSLATFISRIKQPIEVVVYWEEAKYVHHAKNHKDAVTWMNCYPVDAVQFVYNRFGKLQAMRGNHYNVDISV